MDRARRVRNLWSWLPAFRAVAETEHLPTAAEHMQVSASALSRAVRLLEDEIGEPLFNRASRGLTLNPTGHRFLIAVRDAMRLIDDAIEEAKGDTLQGTLRISAVGAVIEPVVVPILAEQLRNWPNATLELESHRAADLPDLLVRGELDLAITTSPIDDPRVYTETIGELNNAVWCAPSHPLAQRKRLKQTDLHGSPFAAPLPDASGRTWDGWPPAWPRIIQARISTMRAGATLCAHGDLLAVLPEIFASLHGGLHRLPLHDLPPTPVFAVTRTPLGSTQRTAPLITAIESKLRSLLTKQPTHRNAAR